MKLPNVAQAHEQTVGSFEKEIGPAIERIKLPSDSMKAVANKPDVPASIRKMPIQINFPQGATLDSLVFALSSVNLQVTFQWSDPTQAATILKKQLPFLNFQGSVGELLSALRNGLGLVSWYEDGMIYISDSQQYSLTLPQNKDVLDTVSKEIKELGAKNIVTSLKGGKIIYSATPSLQDDVLGPFLDRMAKNLAVVNLQVAVVSLSLKDNTSEGFDWDAFKVAFDSTSAGLAAANSTTSASTTSTSTTTTTDQTTSSGSTSLIGQKGAAISVASGALTLGKTSLGNVFGTYGALTIGSAISFLSTFGHTDVSQNVSLKTLSGSKVTLQSGQEVPYVTGVGTTSNGSTTIGSSNTSKVETGLKLELEPYFDSDADIVTVDVGVDLNQILSYVDLKAGTSGTLTQPIVQKQNMKDLVRVSAGKTVVIGGLQYNSDDSSTTEPAALRRMLEARSKVFGKETHNVQRNALFIILRPTITVFDRGN